MPTDDASPLDLLDLRRSQTRLKLTEARAARGAAVVDEKDVRSHTKVVHTLEAELEALDDAIAEQRRRDASLKG